MSDRRSACRPLLFASPLSLQAGASVSIDCQNHDLVFPAPLPPSELKAAANLTMRNCHFRIGGEDVGLMSTGLLWEDKYSLVVQGEAGAVYKMVDSTSQAPCPVRRSQNLSQTLFLHNAVNLYTVTVRACRTDIRCHRMCNFSLFATAGVRHVCACTLFMNV